MLVTAHLHLEHVGEVGAEAGTEVEFEVVMVEAAAALGVEEVEEERAIWDVLGGDGDAETDGALGLEMDVSRREGVGGVDFASTA